MERFGERVRALRTQQNMTQQQLADKVGVSLRTIQYYELDTRRPKNIEKLETLANALDTTSDYLVGRTGVMVAEAYSKGGAEAARDIDKLISEAKGMFAGGQLDDAALDKVMRAFMEAYWIAKDKNSKDRRKSLSRKKDKASHEDNEDH